MVAPHPEARQRIEEALRRASEAADAVPAHEVALYPPKKLGLDDGVIIPGTEFPLGTPPARVRAAAAERPPLRAAVRVIVVLVEFPDRKMQATPERFQELFFSEGTMETGSVRDYYREVTRGLIDIQGEVVGPFELPEDLATYADGDSGMQPALPNARTMARHAAEASNPTVDFGPFDNDGNGFVDAFVVVHAGRDAAETLAKGDIWSHKWVLDTDAFQADATKIYGYLTISEEARLGVCAHELGHLLFGWPDLYDTDQSSNGIGDWCLMASGSWNGDEPGDTPAHPCAWCKAQQKWVEVETPTESTSATIPDVKDEGKIWRLWTSGQTAPEYFLLENRQRTRFDSHIPADGALLWHIDDATETNTNENHYKIAIVQADGLRELEGRVNSGNAGDAFPGSSGNRVFDAGSTPSSKSYAGADTHVSITAISDPGPQMTAEISVSDGGP
jgi:immune inhibitor A